MQTFRFASSVIPYQNQTPIPSAFRILLSDTQLYTFSFIPLTYPRFTSLRVLELAFNGIEFAVFDELRTGLLEPKGDMMFHTNATQIHHPIEMARTDVMPRLSTYNDLLNPPANLKRPQVYLL